MVEEELAALAAAGGAAVVQAAGTSAWKSLEGAVAKWFSRGDKAREHAEVERLARSERTLTTASDGELEQVRLLQKTTWQSRFESAFEGLGDDELEEAAETLRALVETFGARNALKSDRGTTIHGNVDIRADHGSAAAMHIETVTFNNPPPPGPHQGLVRPASSLPEA